MNLNSPVKILSQGVKTHLVPDRGMCTESSTAEVKRRAGPDALAAPDAKKRATTGLPKCSTQEDQTPAEASGVCKEVLGSLLPLGKAYPGDDDKEVYEYVTDGPGDVETLKEVVALVHDRSSGTYKARCELITKSQRSFEKRANDKSGYTGKLYVKIVLNEGRVAVAVCCGW